MCNIFDCGAGLVPRVWQRHEVPPETGEGEGQPRVRVEVLLLCKERPGCALLGLRTNCDTAKGLYQAPGVFVRFGETWEAAAARAAQQETGLMIEGPRVCTVVETVRNEDRFHCVSIFMAARVTQPDPRANLPDGSICTGKTSRHFQILLSDFVQR